MPYLNLNGNLPDKKLCFSVVGKSLISHVVMQTTHTIRNVTDKNLRFSKSFSMFLANSLRSFSRYCFTRGGRGEPRLSENIKMERLVSGYKF